jgi:signal transduction histidine kinase
MARKQTARRFVLCVKNDDCDDFEKRKVYRVLVDLKAEKDGYLRVIDESGDDYLYPVSYFVKLDLPHEAEQAIAAAE